MKGDIEEKEADDEEEEKSHCNVGCLKSCATMASNYKTPVFGVAVLVYLLIGGAIFSALERPNETRQNEQIAANNESYMRQYEILVSLVVNNTNLSRIQVQALIKNISETAIAANVEETNNWIYASSVFFCTTVVTTIGYGAVAPVTEAGRAFFTPYAILGIPLALVFIASLGGNLNKIFMFTAKLCVKPKFVKKSYSKATIILVNTLIGLIIFAFIPAAIFYAIEGWTYSESLYFTFVTMTTVGFGDFVPSVLASGVYRLCIGGWIFVSLAFLALIISEIQEFIENFKLKEALNKIKKKRNDENTELGEPPQDDDTE